MIKHWLFKTAIICIVLSVFLTGCSSEKKETIQSVQIKFGVLPALQTLPLFVARDMGYFEAENIEVELVMFNTATDKDIAITGGAIDGYFGDLLTPAVIENNGVDITIVARNYSTDFDRRMFAILTKPGSEYTTAADLKGIPIAVSSNSVIEYVTELLLSNRGLANDDIAYAEVKNIGLRMQMLMSGQIEAATLPEPLVTAAIAGGATLIAHDSALAVSQTILAFRSDFAISNGKSVTGFLKAIDRANEYINAHPDSVRTIMVSNIRLPEPLKNKYPVPRFPQLSLPDSSTIATVTSWLLDKNVIDKKLNYSDLTDDRFLK